MVLLLLSLSSYAKSSFPKKDINDIVVFGAGGGTDTLNRVVTSEMAKVLRVNINVTNVPGGAGGSMGLMEADKKTSDGYTLIGLSESIVTAPVMGGFDKTVDNWDFFVIGGSPEVLSVAENSKYKTLEDFVKYAKANPEKIKVGASTAGSFHHINMLFFEKGLGIKLNFVPYQGSADSQNALLTGELDAVFTSAAEQAPLIKGNKFRPLAMLTPNDFTIGDKKIESAFKKYPKLDQYLPIYQAIGLAVKSDVDAYRREKLEKAFRIAMNTETVQNKLKDMYYVSYGLTGEKALRLFKGLESKFSWTLWDLKTATVNPEKFGIEKP
jgi:tripartite-type tricarboxylate transporter receptor subunit TctC